MRTRTRTEARVAALLLTALGGGSALLLTACGGGSAQKPGATGDDAQPVISDVQRYLPLTANTVFAFITEVENTGEKGVLMMSIDRPRPEHAVLMVGGKAQRLEIVPEGVRLATGGWLLKAPLSEGATFRGQFANVVVKSTNKSVEVPAGRFTGCIETVEEGVAVKKRVTTVFCPDVGIVLLDAEGAIGDDFGRERALLRSHGPRVDINDLPPQK